MSTHGQGKFGSSGGQVLFEQWWCPEGEARGVLAICHGYAEHSGRYADVADYLTARGFVVEALDLRGHGRSSGERVFVNDFDEYLDDLETFLARVRERNAGKPVFLLGHSMGGGVVSNYMVARPSAAQLAGVLLSGAGMLGPRPTPAPNEPPRAPAPLPASAISRDPNVVAAYENDPLVYRGAPSPNRVEASRTAYQRVQSGMDAIELPLLIMHGTDDLLVPYRGSEILFERAASKDKTLKLYPGLYHEILNEPEKDQVLAEVAAWLEARTAV